MTRIDLTRFGEMLSTAEPLQVQGRVLRATGLVIEAALPGVAMGTACEITARGRKIIAEVVGFSGATALLMPFGDVQGVCEGAAVIPRASAAELPVGDGLLGRVINSAGRPVDNGPAPILRGRAPLKAEAPHAMSRRRISKPLETGIRCIDSCLTLGEGQRVAVMAGPGVGKSVLLGMIAQHATADVIVVGLIGERGREVREFVERDLGTTGLARSVVVVATSDEPPLVRVRAAMAATAIAESYRAQGLRVMLLMDSLSRVAMAQREIGLAAGEPPTSKGYPPSVFAALPQLTERAGNDAGKGSITALYTVLAEGDDLADPVVDAARAALDGHWVLSRKLANSGHFPAIDLLASISRVMSDITTQQQRDVAGQARDILSAYQEAADLVEVGAYVAGSNPRVDRAVKCLPQLMAFLKQRPGDRFTYAQSLEQLTRAVAIPPEVRRA
jgi:FliI/YscN family ATPase